MKRIFFASFLIFFISASNICAQKNWTPLFDGTTLTGWKQLTGKATFQPFRGTIMGVSAPNSPNSFLCTEAEYGDFALEISQNIVHGSDSPESAEREIKIFFPELV